MPNAVNTQTRASLPPLPSLEEHHLTVHTVKKELHQTVAGPLEALVPAAAPYLCSDPTAPAFLLVPGLGMDGLGFLRQLPLGAHSRLHFFQTPNEPVKDEVGLYRFARYVEEYILANGLDRQPGGLVLGGCSMGGAISLAIALRGRVKLRGLVLIGTFGSCRHLPRWQRFAAPLSHVIPLGLMRSFAWLVVARTPLFGTVSKDEAHWLVSYKIKRTQRYFAAAVMALTRQEQVQAAANLRLPTIVLHGTEDRVLPYAAGVELAQTIPNARLVTVADAGHALFFTHHDPVNAAIAEFLSDLPP